MRWYDGPLGHIGRRFVTRLTEGLKLVRTIGCKYERALVFVGVILPTRDNDWSSNDISTCIQLWMDLQDQGRFVAPVEECMGE